MTWLLAFVCVLAQVDERAVIEHAATGRTAVVERWREALALDRPKDVLAERALVDANGALQHDGEAAALVARALFSARSDGGVAASEFLAGVQADENTRAFVALERIYVQIESDALAAALIALLPSPEAKTPRFAEHSSSWLYVGRAWARSGRLDSAVPFLARFVELAPRDADAVSALHLLAQAALARRDGAAAQALVRRAEELGQWHALWRARVIQVREHPDEALPRLGLGQLWLQAGDGVRAKAVLGELCVRAPQLASAWFHLGEAERMLGDFDAAQRAYDRALEREPDYVLALNNRGTIHRLAGRTAQARADFERIVDGPHTNERNALSAHLALARLLDVLGENEAAARRYARFVELGGADPLRVPTK